MRPDFDIFLKMLRREKLDRAVLFELFMNPKWYEYFAGRSLESDDLFDELKLKIDAFANAGYDYTTTHACPLKFKAWHKEKQSISLNHESLITDEKSFLDFSWPDPDAYSYELLTKSQEYLPDGMKLMVMGPGGVLENVISLTGFDNLCYMLFDEPELVQSLFDKVGSILLRYYENSLSFESVGFIASNDDWGFNTQTFLSVENMRKYVFPWHKKIVSAAHKNGKPAILHSCGYMFDVMDDIIDDMGYDGKHSFEDNICAVEESYKKWGSRIAILGGIDVNFLVEKSPEEIKARCAALLDLTQNTAYALGSGNSIADYVPLKSYLAMQSLR